MDLETVLNVLGNRIQETFNSSQAKDVSYSAGYVAAITDIARLMGVELEIEKRRKEVEVRMKDRESSR